MFTYKNYKTA